MNIEQMNYKTARSVGHTVKDKDMAERGFSLRNFKDCNDLYIFRYVGSSWKDLFEAMVKMFDVNRHLKVVICVLPCGV